MPMSELDEALEAAIAGAAEAGERFAQAKTDLEHRLAAVDDAVLTIVSRVYEALPAEYQRVVTVRRNGREEEMPLPEFVRLMMEAPGGTAGSFRIDVEEDLYADGDDDEDEEERDIGGDEDEE